MHIQKILYLFIHTYTNYLSIIVLGFWNPPELLIIILEGGLVNSSTNQVYVFSNSMSEYGE